MEGGFRFLVVMGCRLEILEVSLEEAWTTLTFRSAPRLVKIVSALDMIRLSVVLKSWI